MVQMLARKRLELKNKENPMNKKLSQILENLKEELLPYASDYCVGIHIFINEEGFEIRYNLKTPIGLRQSDISMRNLKGEFIR